MLVIFTVTYIHYALRKCRKYTSYILKYIQNTSIVKYVMEEAGK